MKKKFSRNWIGSKQPRKQRKYRYNAPLHIKQKFMSVNLSKYLREEYKIRNILLKKGYTVKILRGGFKGKTGKVERVNLKREKVYIEGVYNVKKDGTKAPYPIHPSNLSITEMKLDERKRNKLTSRLNIKS